MIRTPETKSSYKYSNNDGKLLESTVTTDMTPSEIIHDYIVRQETKPSGLTVYGTVNHIFYQETPNSERKKITVPSEEFQMARHNLKLKGYILFNEDGTLQDY